MPDSVMQQLAFVWPGEETQLDMNGRDREQVREMELRTYDCGAGCQFHAAHTVERDGQTYLCPGLATRMCGKTGIHNHHRWAEPDAFYWCQPFDYLVSADAPVRPGLVRSVSAGGTRG